MHLHVLFKLSLTAFIMIFSASLRAEIYQWTDEHGQTHFGDRAPSPDAKEISQQVNQINIASDLSSPEMMLEHAKEKEKQRAEQSNPQHDQAEKQARQKKCKEMKKTLNTIKRPVIFVDENGKDLKLTEAQRKQHAQDLEHHLHKYCQ